MTMLMMAPQQQTTQQQQQQQSQQQQTTTTRIHNSTTNRNRNVSPTNFICLIVLLMLVGIPLMRLSIISHGAATSHKLSKLSYDPKTNSTTESHFDVNGPPEWEPTVQRTRVDKPRHHDNNGEEEEDDEKVPVIDMNDDYVPLGINENAAGMQHIVASEILECRSSVLNFVINATDGKDECKGLKRAFDKTCNSDVASQTQEEASSSQTIQNDNNSASNSERQQQRKLMFQQRHFTTLNLSFWNKSLRQVHYSFYRLLKWLKRLWNEQLLQQKHDIVQFYAEDHVAFQWSEANYLVQHDLDRLQLEHFMQDYRRRQLKNNKEAKTNKEQQTDDEAASSTKKIQIPKSTTNFSMPVKDPPMLDNSNQSTSIASLSGETDQEEEEEEAEEDTTPENENQEEKDNRPALNTDKTEEGKPRKQQLPQSLNLPTSAQHISEHMLSETLLLQKEKDAIMTVKQMAAHANETAVNATAAASSSSMSDAAVDAVVSAKMVEETTNVISAVLNDPESVEARTCCTSILSVYRNNCDTPDEEVVSDKKLFLIVFVIALCGMVKSMIRHYKLNWLPEAGGCILVGVACGAVLSFVPHYDISFDGDWFLRIMVPPIVFEAALSINKKSFQRHIVPIVIYAILGTLLATTVTAFILRLGTTSKYLFRGLCEPIPYVESLAFGALISSIDPIAVLSVMSNLGMTDTDTIYVIIFGESLLNDGVAIVLFETLVHFLDASLHIDGDAIISGFIHFFVVAFGSLSVGIGSGFACTIYYWLMQGCQTPLVEVLMFFCWAFIPYYLCDGMGWSGIVSVVATGFIMDLFVVGQHQLHNSQHGPHDENSPKNGAEHHNHGYSPQRRQRRPLFYKEGHLSNVAKNHVGFVTELLATLMETAIFAYLGVFLFSYRYHWNFWHTFLAITACCLSRAIMIPLLSLLANWITKMQQIRLVRDCRAPQGGRLKGLSRANNGASSDPVAACITPSNSQDHPADMSSTSVVLDRKMQLVLWVAGLRGAMSFALVENIPLYDAVTGEGTRLKAELKAMTSVTIVFTVFLMGGSTYYLMDYLGMVPKTNNPSTPGFDNDEEHQALLRRPNPRGVRHRSKPLQVRSN